MSSHEMPEWRRRQEKARRAVEIILERLTALPPTSDVATLKLKAARALDTLRGLQAPPAPAHEEWLLKRVLCLHLSTAGLERVAPSSRRGTGPGLSWARARPQSARSNTRLG